MQPPTRKGVFCGVGAGWAVGGVWWGGCITPTLPFLHPPSEHATWVACWIL